ncbi:MAG: flippase-like domain-containing protein [Clostridiales bacterium]|nr:flippase-like domain-containing protein [Clostridiales bacterium]
MKQRLTQWIGVPLILLILLIILAIGFSNGEIVSAAAILRGLSSYTILGCLICFVGYIVFDALGIHSALRRQGYRLLFRDTLMVSVRGQYYYYITPGASGGQPMQIYYLRELGIPAGAGTSVLVCHFVAFQTMLALLMTVFAIPYWGYIRENVGLNFPLLVIGYLVNAAGVAFALICSLTRGPVRLLIRFCDFFIRKLRLSRHPEELHRRLLDTVELFHTSAAKVFQHPGEIFLQMFYGAMQQFCLMTVLFVIYRGLGHREASLGQILAMGFVQYVSASYVPIPGASGAQEGVFTLYFGAIFGAQCFAAMMIWRTTTFYLPLLVSAGTIIARRIRRKKAQTGHPAE